MDNPKVTFSSGNQDRLNESNDETVEFGGLPEDVQCSGTIAELTNPTLVQAVISGSSLEDGGYLENSSKGSTNRLIDGDDSSNQIGKTAESAKVIDPDTLDSKIEDFNVSVVQDKVNDPGKRFVSNHGNIADDTVSNHGDIAGDAVRNHGNDLTGEVDHKASDLRNTDETTEIENVGGCKNSPIDRQRNFELPDQSLAKESDFFIPPKDYDYNTKNEVHSEVADDFLTTFQESPMKDDFWSNDTTFRFNNSYNDAEIESPATAGRKLGSVVYDLNTSEIENTDGISIERPNFTSNIGDEKHGFTNLGYVSELDEPAGILRQSQPYFFPTKTPSNSMKSQSTSKEILPAPIDGDFFTSRESKLHRTIILPLLLIFVLLIASTITILIIRIKLGESKKDSTNNEFVQVLNSTYIPTDVLSPSSKWLNNTNILLPSTNIVSTTTQQTQSNQYLTESLEPSTQLLVKKSTQYFTNFNSFQSSIISDTQSNLDIKTTKIAKSSISGQATTAIATTTLPSLSVQNSQSSLETSQTFSITEQYLSKSFSKGTVSISPIKSSFVNATSITVAGNSNSLESQMTSMHVPHEEASPSTDYLLQATLPSEHKSISSFAPSSLPYSNSLYSSQELSKTLESPSSIESSQTESDQTLPSMTFSSLLELSTVESNLPSSLHLSLLSSTLSITNLESSFESLLTPSSSIDHTSLISLANSFLSSSPYMDQTTVLRAFSTNVSPTLSPSSIHSVIHGSNPFTTIPSKQLLLAIQAHH
ncbi:uncharacterized protein [Clytia hemisphaerica]